MSIEGFFDKEKNISKKYADKLKLKNICTMMGMTEDEMNSLSEEEKQDILNNVEYQEF